MQSTLWTGLHLLAAQSSRLKTQDSLDSSRILLVSRLILGFGWPILLYTGSLSSPLTGHRSRPQLDPRRVAFESQTMEDDYSVGEDMDITTAPGSHHPVLWGLLLSSLAGGSTTIGGLIGVWRRPNDSTLAFLLGVAIGVMMLLAVVEMWVHNALEHGSFVVTVGFVVGAGLYRLLQVCVRGCRLRQGWDRAGTSRHTRLPDVQRTRMLAVLSPYCVPRFL